MSLPIYASFRLFDQKEGGESLNIFYLPTFLVSNLVLSDWLEFTIVCLLQNVIAFGYIEDFKQFESIKYIAFYTLLFASYEKVRKEWFIVSHTNSKTKKILLGLLNQTN